jgi:hypothetical protein
MSENYSSKVNAVAFLYNAARLASALNDNTVKI